MKSASVLLSILCLLGPHAASAPESPRLTVHATMGVGLHFRIERWAPVTVRLANTGPPIRGEVVVSATDPVSKERSIVSKPVSLPTESKKLVHLYVRVRSWDTVKVVLRTVDGRVLAEDVLPVVNPAYEGTVALVIDDTPGRFASLIPRSREILEKAMRVAHCEPAMLPDRWLGYDAFDLVILHAVSFDALSDRQKHALVKWVEAGGRVVACIGRFANQYRNRYALALLGLRDVAEVTISSEQELQESFGPDLEWPGKPFVACRAEPSRAERRPRPGAQPSR